MEEKHTAGIVKDDPILGKNMSDKKDSQSEKWTEKKEEISLSKKFWSIFDTLKILQIEDISFTKKGYSYNIKSTETEKTFPVKKQRSIDKPITVSSLSRSISITKGKNTLELNVNPNETVNISMNWEKIWIYDSNFTSFFDETWILKQEGSVQSMHQKIKSYLEEIFFEFKKYDKQIATKKLEENKEEIEKWLKKNKEKMTAIKNFYKF